MSVIQQHTVEELQNKLRAKQTELIELPEYHRLLDILKERSFKRGDFTLASGQKSDYYLDVRLTSLNPEGAILIGQILWHMIKAYSIDAIGGLTMGADPLVTAVTIAAQLDTPKIAPAGFLVRKAAKDHGAKQQIEGLVSDFIPQRIVLLEDVTTTGGSILQAYDAVKKHYPQAEIPFALTVVDRRSEQQALQMDTVNVPLGCLYTVSSFNNPSRI